MPIQEYLPLDSRLCLSSLVKALRQDRADSCPTWLICVSQFG